MAPVRHEGLPPEVPVPGVWLCPRCLRPTARGAPTTKHASTCLIFLQRRAAAALTYAQQLVVRASDRVSRPCNWV
eukprot:365940-Chlamydomonas_euryale.AAC.5